MNEHDSLVSHALNNMTVNEMVGEYAWLKLDNKKLYAALKKISEFNDGLFDGIKISSISQIARDAINAQGEK